MCDKCQKYINQKYAICPKCGKHFKNDNIDEIIESVLLIMTSNYIKSDKKIKLDKLSKQIPNGTSLYLLSTHKDTISYRSFARYHGIFDPDPSYLYKAEYINIITNTEMINTYYPFLKYIDGWEKNIVRITKEYMKNHDSKLSLVYGNNIVVLQCDKPSGKPLLPIYYIKDRFNDGYNKTELVEDIISLPYINQYNFSQLGKIKSEDTNKFITEFFNFDISDN